MAGTPSELVRRVLLAGERLRRVLDQSDSHSELNGPRVDVLETIAAAGAVGCSQTALATELGAAESSVSTLVERMRRDGLLLRMRSRQDRRCSVLLLTEVGGERLASAMSRRDLHLAQWIDRLSTGEQQELNGLLDQLLLVLKDHPLPETIPESESARKSWGKAA
jgi:DNA-binding MarR family transcriptional regulator